MTTTNKSNKVSIIGLGQMGRKLTQLYLDAGYEVIVWNRTASKASDLNHVKIAGSAGEAVRDSTICIICVYDNNATLEIFESIPEKNVFADKTVINLTTGSPKEAHDIEKMINAQGGYYINGAIQVAPDQMGLESTTILLSGSLNAYQQSKSFMDVLGGNLKYLSEKPSASSAMDLATLTWLYGSYIGLIYAVKLCQQYGLELKDFSEVVGEVTPGYTDFFKYEIDVIQRGDFRVTQSPLPISVAATRRIADSFRELNVIQDFPEILAGILEKAHHKGLHNEELAAIIKVIGEPKI
ncbi:MAG TPA: NAD(P)-binding domain-containing protein [Sphingobacteriaceae bacterium]